MQTVVSTIEIAFQSILLFFFVYWFIISLFGFGKPKQQKEHEASKRFLILIPAHNEEKVIGSLVKNLTQLDYPKDLYDIRVIADNCTDDTAKISKELGASVIEHTSLQEEPKGKPYGIKYAIEQIGERLTKDYDAIVFFDADNLVSLNFLKEMNNHLLNGDKLIQGYLDTKNPNDNWVTLSYATSYYYMNRSWQLAKSRLKLGNAIGGTGFCVDTQLFEEVGWTAKSLTEDLEFTMQCLLKGVPAKWSHFAKVYDEKPEKLWVSIVQRLRWARGHWDVCFKYTGKLFWRSIKKFDIQAFDGAMYLLNPGRIILNATTAIIIMLTLFDIKDWFYPIFPWWVWACSYLFQIVYIKYSTWKDSKEKIGVIRAFVSLIMFNLTYVPLFFYSLVTKNNKTWKRTEHTRSIELNEVETKTK